MLRFPSSHVFISYFSGSISSRARHLTSPTVCLISNCWHGCFLPLRYINSLHAFPAGAAIEKFILSLYIFTPSGNGYPCTSFMSIPSRCLPDAYCHPSAPYISTFSLLIINTSIYVSFSNSLSSRTASAVVTAVFPMLIGDCATVPAI